MSSTRAERRLILLSAGTTERRSAAAAQARALARSVDWSQLESNLRSRNPLPLLGPRMLEWGCTPSTGFAGSVEQSLGVGRRQGAFLELVSSRVIAALADAGIRATPLK